MNAPKWFRSLVVAVGLAVVAGCAASLPNYSAVLTNPDRPANERELDAARKPHEVLAFYGVREGLNKSSFEASHRY